MRLKMQHQQVMEWTGNFIFLAFAWVMTYTGLPSEAVVILAVLICIDFATGIGKSLAIGRPITSKRMRIGLISKLGLLLVPLVVALAAKGLTQDLVWVVDYVVNLMILSEAYSIIANVYAMKKGKEAPEWDVMSIILKQIKNIVNRVEGGSDK